MAVHFRKNPPDKMEISTETQLLPILGLASSILNGENAKKEEPSETEKKDESFNPLKPMFVRHHSSVIDLIASEASVPPSDVIDFELVLYDTQKSCIGGINDEFIFSPRLDNQGMSFCALTALIRASKTAIEDSNTINLISLFDHEEVGSLSQQGADGNLLPSVLKRLCDLGKPSASALEQTSAKSFIISADMAHAVHPNYVGAYESKHHPMLNGGTVLKINANQRYTTNSPGIVLLQEIARKKEVPLQLFVVDNTSPCGGTIGPMSAAKTGIRTLDLGNPQLSMHSIRETGGVVDVEYGVRLFEGFFEGYGALEEQIIVD
ncbi:hypothetical protein MMC25_002500 [Agyrium rufum]|nr:hypothetical protein [Agyrium rufum]